ncbi:MAG: preprotein translocase subunit SecG, partial [Acidimicrobiales bacterium]
MFTWTFITIEALASIGLIFLVLLHSGRGGGISDLLGGSMGSAASGSTVVERN